jgi:hypothetical protein
MPKPGWIGKQYIVNHTDEVPFQLLERAQRLRWARTPLLPYCCERVKLGFIEPPYNTGNEN